MGTELGKLLNESTPSNKTQDRIRDYEQIGGLVYRKCGPKSLFLIPRSMRKAIVIAAHDLSGNFSVDRTIAKILKEYWFPMMRRYVKQHIYMCVDCLIHKRPGGRRPGLLHHIPPGRRSFAVIHIDHLGPFKTSTKGNRYLLVIVDNLTKYVFLYASKTTDTAGVIKRLEEFIKQRGLPDRIVSDRGTAFTSARFEKFCQEQGVHHTLNLTRHPQANGQVERVNRTLFPYLVSLA